MTAQQITPGSYSDTQLRMTYYTRWGYWLFPFRFTADGNVKA